MIRLYQGGLIAQNVQAETIFDAQIGYDFQLGSMLNGLSLYLQGQNLTDERVCDASGTTLRTNYLPEVPDVWAPVPRGLHISLQCGSATTASAAAASSAAPAASGDADLRGRVGYPCDRGLPGTAATAAPATSGTRARLI